MKKVILIKLGGSAITDKSSTKKAKPEKIRQLAKEIASARKQIKDLLILGHGAGSFAHKSAAKYKTINGVKTKRDLLGMSEVKYDASTLNMIIFEQLFRESLPVFTLPPSAFITTENKKLSQISLSPLLNLLNFNVVPLVYGDVITDSKIGATIFSTEQILNEIALALPSSNYQPKFIVEAGNTDGVFNRRGETIPVISKNNIDEILDQLTGSRGTDVTGGMLHKVKEAYNLAQKGIPTLIISAEKGQLENAILGKKTRGTWVKI
jgi:isopentenyl phosphate kinase